MPGPPWAVGRYDRDNRFNPTGASPQGLRSPFVLLPIRNNRFGNAASHENAA